jgi:hypothetical protein
MDLKYINEEPELEFTSGRDSQWFDDTMPQEEEGERPSVGNLSKSTAKTRETNSRPAPRDRSRNGYREPREMVIGKRALTKRTETAPQLSVDEDRKRNPHLYPEEPKKKEPPGSRLLLVEYPYDSFTERTTPFRSIQFTEGPNGGMVANWAAGCGPGGRLKGTSSMTDESSSSSSRNGILGLTGHKSMAMEDDQQTIEVMPKKKTVEKPQLTKAWSIFKTIQKKEEDENSMSS